MTKTNPCLSSIEYYSVNLSTTKSHTNKKRKNIYKKRNLKCQLRENNLNYIYLDFKFSVVGLDLFCCSNEFCRLTLI